MQEIIQNPRDPIFITKRNFLWRSWSVSAYDQDFPARAEKAALTQGQELQRTSGKAVFLINMPEGKFVMKKYWESRFFRYLFRPSQTLRELRGYQQAALLKLPAARVVACSALRPLLYLKEDFIITEYIEDSHSGTELARHGALSNDIPRRNCYVKENIRRLARLHDAGFTHGGAHPRNFLWNGTADDMQIMWIDLPTVRRHPEGISLQEGTDALNRHFLSKFDLSPQETTRMNELYCSSRKNIPPQSRKG